MVDSFFIRAPIDNGTLAILHLFGIKTITVFVNILDDDVPFWNVKRLKGLVICQYVTAPVQVNSIAPAAEFF